MVKNYYYLNRLLQSNVVVEPIKKHQVNIHHSDSISFYESLSGKQDMFPSMVGKVKEIEASQQEKYKENFVNLDRKSTAYDDDLNNLSSDFEAFNLKLSPRTRVRIKRNQMQSSQLRKQNFHENFYKKLLHGSEFYFSVAESDEESQFSDVELI